MDTQDPLTFLAPQGCLSSLCCRRGVSVPRTLSGTAGITGHLVCFHSLRCTCFGTAGAPGWRAPRLHLACSSPMVSALALQWLRLPLSLPVSRRLCLHVSYIVQTLLRKSPGLGESGISRGEGEVRSPQEPGPSTALETVHPALGVHCCTPLPRGGGCRSPHHPGLSVRAP